MGCVNVNTNIVPLKNYFNKTDILLKNNERNIVCSVIQCYIGKYLMPLDRTSCGKGAWCHRRRCVQDNRAPRAPGDRMFD